MDSIPEVINEKGIGAVLDEAKKFSGSTIGEAARRLESAVRRPCFNGNREDAINLIRKTRIDAQKEIVRQGARRS